MKRIALVSALLSAPALAQQTAPAVTYAPVNIDGQTTANGLITVDGKSYVSVDALVKGQVTLLTPNTFGIYAFPVAQGALQAKLKGCVNEWLSDGTTRVRATGQALKSGWEIELQWQTTQDGVIAFDNIFQSDQALLAFKNGTVFDTKVNKLVQSRSSVGATTRGGLDGGQMLFFAAGLTQNNPPVRMVLRPLKGAAWTFELNCKK